MAGHLGAGAVVAAVVEDADDPDAVLAAGLQGADQLLGRRTAADDGGAAIEAAPGRLHGRPAGDRGRPCSS
jgi:hypothetical protein